MRHGPYDVRLALDAELEQLASIERAAATLFMGTAYESVVDTVLSLDYLQARQRAGTVWVASVIEPVGFAVATLVSGVAYLNELDVHPDHGRRGLGRSLVECVADWSRCAGHDDLLLSTFSAIAWNAPYYARLGFRVLTPDEYADAQMAIRDSESAQGLPIHERAIMARRVAPLAER